MRWPTSPSSVAENSIVWVRPVQWRRIHSTCGVNPSSAMRSASSSTTTSTSSSEISADFSRSIRRSGVATTTSTPSLQLVDLVAGGWRRRTPGRMRWPAWAATGSSTSATCTASSRVGTSTSPSGRAGSASSVIRASIGHAERERLAGAGAGPAADVAALHRDRDRFGLDRERLGEPGGGEAVVDAGRDAEVGEAGGRLDRRQRRDGGEGGGAVGAGHLVGGAARSPPAAGCAPPFERFCHGGCQASWGDVRLPGGSPPVTAP